MPSFGNANFYAKISARGFSVLLNRALKSSQDCAPLLNAIEKRKIRDLDFVSLIYASTIFSNVKKFVLDKLGQKGGQNFLGILQILRQQIRLGYLSYVPPDPAVKGSFSNPQFAFRIELMIDGENMTTKDLGIGRTKIDAKQEAARLLLRGYVLGKLVTPAEIDNSEWERSF